MRSKQFLFHKIQVQAILLFLLPAFPVMTHAEGFYIGFLFSAVSKGGLTLGYRADNQNSFEIYFNGVPHVFAYGLFLKHYASEANRDYFLLGYASLNWAGHSKEVKTSHGLNVGYGYRFGADHEAWSYPVEIGGGPGYDFSDQTFVPQFFVGGGALYGENQAKQ